MTVQAPIASGFGSATNSDEIMQSLSLKGKVAIVTGGYSGLGLETALQLAKAGAEVFIPTRDVERTQKTFGGTKGITIEPMDLLDPLSIDRFIDSFLAREKPLHYLINNAGIMASPLSRDRRGFESQFATNHLGHFQLTLGLRKALVRANGARVVSVSSRGHRYSDVVFDDIHYRNRAYAPFEAYGQSKTANILFAVELDRLGQSDHIRAFSVHPGSIVDTGLQKYVDPQDLKAAGVIDGDGKAIHDAARNLKTVPQGAATQLWCALSPQLNGMGGVYCENCDIAVINQGLADKANQNIGGIANGVLPYAIDPNSAKRLWKVSEDLLFAGRSQW
ncbi:MAG: SDR family NAD(P)-dependent oxidoreductase [Proteobacteria bacterium]|nr:MAG: SDR family NAD(P)-dependent oxidoreductase [Pseudomonadota bacterium]